jgi:hypothetical protein
VPNAAIAAKAGETRYQCMTSPLGDAKPSMAAIGGFNAHLDMSLVNRDKRSLSQQPQQARRRPERATADVL